MKDCNYKPSGDLQGDPSGIPNRGSSTGFNDGAVTDGMSTDPSATNRIGSLRGTDSDAMDQDKSGDQRA